MNRLGWLLLLGFVLIAGVFALVVRRSEAPPDAVAQADAAGEAGPLPVPVDGVTMAQLADTWSDSRGGGARVHNAIDIMAPRGAPVRSATDGIVEKIFESGDGGHTVYVRTPDRRWQAYYAHLDGYAPGLAEGQRVARGDPIGTVGFTGNASPAGPHLHFAYNRIAPGAGWWQGVPVNPYPLMAGR